MVDGGNTSDKVAIAHSGTFDLDCELISRENYSDEINIEAVDTNGLAIDYQKHNSLEHAIWNALSYDSLHTGILSNSGTACVKVPGKEEDAAK